MLENILIFILFLCPLVFFHELGHFIFARICGVRVEVFSIGFGPKLIKWKGGDTQYAFSLIPLGGYVKMFGDDPLNKDAIPEEERKFSFTHKSKWSRFWIVLGGPLANFIMAYGIFFLLLLVGEKLPEIKFGAVENSTMFYSKGVRSGDSLRKVNGKEVFSPSDVALGGDIIETITVARRGEAVKVNLGIESKTFFDEFFKNPPFLRAPMVVSKTGEQYAVSLTETGVDWDLSLDEISERFSGRDIYLYEVTKDTDGEAPPEVKAAYFKKLNITGDSRRKYLLKLKEVGFLSHDLMVKSVSRDSPADKIGVLGKDILTSLDGKEIVSFNELRTTLQATDGGEVKVSVYQKGVLQNFKITPDIKDQGGKKVKLMGVYSDVRYTKMKFIQTESKGLIGSFLGAFSKTWETVIKTAVGFKKIITNEVSLKNIGGPLMIGKVASDSFKTSLSYFFQIMALISVNLGLINLFPIPVLDGGHILFIGLEVVNRGPLSRRKMEIAQQFGLSLLLILTFAALYNDFTKIFF